MKRQQPPERKRQKPRRGIRSTHPPAQLLVETMVAHHNRKVAQATKGVDNKLPEQYKRKLNAHLVQTKARAIEIHALNDKLVRELSRINARPPPVDSQEHKRVLQKFQERKARKKALSERQLALENERMQNRLWDALKHRPGFSRLEATPKPEQPPARTLPDNNEGSPAPSRGMRNFEILQQQQPQSPLYHRRTLANLLDDFSPQQVELLGSVTNENEGIPEQEDSNVKREAQNGLNKKDKLSKNMPAKSLMNPTCNIHRGQPITRHRQSDFAPSVPTGCRRDNKHPQKHRHLSRSSRGSHTNRPTPCRKNTNNHHHHTDTAIQPEPNNHVSRQCSLVEDIECENGEGHSSVFRGTVLVPIIDFMPRSTAASGTLEQVKWRHDLIPNANESDDVAVVIGSYLCQVSVTFTRNDSCHAVSSASPHNNAAPAAEDHTIVLEAIRINNASDNDSSTCTTMEQYTSIEAREKDLNELFDVTDLRINSSTRSSIAHLVAKFLWLHATGNRSSDSSNTTRQRTHRTRFQTRATRFSPKLMLFPRNHLTSVANDVKRRRGSQVMENGLIFALAQDIEEEDVMDLESAATRLQATIRGHKQRRVQKQIEWAALRLQTVFRGHRGRIAFKQAQNVFLKQQAMQQNREMQAARHLQAVFRGHHQRGAREKCIGVRNTQIDGMGLQITLSVRGVHLLVEAVGQGESESLLLPNNKIFHITGQPIDLSSCGPEEAQFVASAVCASLKWRYGFLQKLGHLYSSYTLALGETWVPFRRCAGRGTDQGELVLLSMHQVSSKKMMAGQEDAVVLAVQLQDVRRLESIWFEVSTPMQLAQLKGFVEVPPNVLVDIGALL